MKRRKKEQTGGAAAAVQGRERGGHPFAALRGYMPLGGADAALYRSVREVVPIVDAAIGKLVRLSGGFRVLCEDERAQEELGEFLRTVNVGHAQVGFNAFLDKYLDSLLTNGRAVGEIVPDAEGREIAAVLCHRVEQLALREGETALDVRFCGYDAEAARAAAAGAGAFHAAAAGVGESLRRVAAALDALYGGAALAHLLRGGAELGALRQRALRGGL